MQRFLVRRLRSPGLALLLGLLPGAALAQTGTIRGTVTDSLSTKPLEGALVTVLGTTIHTATLADGAYVLTDVPVGTVQVRVQMIGYGPRSRPVTVSDGEEASADFSMVLRPVQLDEIVVTGYGTQSRGALTNAVSSVEAPDIENIPTAGIDNALTGKAAGVEVIQNAGNPGNGITVRVRGSASITASNQPLYVVDGVVVNSEDISQLDLGGQGITGVTGLSTSDIASVDILKDAGAAAIYGSRGSNGVVMITTKRGSAGPARVSFNTYVGTQSATKRVSMLNASQYLTYMNEAAANDGYGDDYFGVVGVDDTVNTNWQSAVLRSAPIGNVDLAVTGGDERLRYRLSGTYFDQDGIVIGSSYRRLGGRLNLDFGAEDKIAYSASLAVTGETNHRIENDNSLSGIITNAIANQPTMPVRRSSDGQFTGTDDGLSYANPVALADFNSALARTTRVEGSFEARGQVARSLHATGRVGVDLENLRENQYESPRVIGIYAASVNGVSKSGYSLSNRYAFDGFLTWDRTWAERHSLNLVAGSSLELTRGELNFVRGEQLSSQDLHQVRNAAVVTVWDGRPTENNLVSYFARANYGYADKYLLGASFRVDGSSRFGPNDRYGVFPAVSGAWVLSEEPFLKGNHTVDFLKLRASYGLTGNQAISDYPWQGTFCSANYSGQAGLSPCTLANPDLKWERTAQFDAGADLTLFQGRVNLIADWYHKLTSNLIVNRPITATSGFTNVFDNVGNLLNKGIEFQLSTDNLQPHSANGLGWTTTFNLSHNINRVTKLFQNQPFDGGYDDINRVEAGQPLGVFYTYKFLGVDPQSGDAIYQDKDGDGQITSADRFIIGSPWPSLTGGITNTLTFRRFDLSFFFQFSKGAKVYNAMSAYSNDGGYYPDNKFSDVLHRWQQPGDVTNQPRASYDGTSGATLPSSRFIEDADYLRLQDLTLGFQFPERVANSMGFTHARLYVSAHNVFTATGYDGFFPDVNSSGSTANIALGTDFYAYPIARTFTFGVQAGW
jgi:TonB-linked SusC/RagA family outer membrane protein